MARRCPQLFGRLSCAGGPSKAEILVQSRRWPTIAKVSRAIVAGIKAEKAVLQAAEECAQRIFVLQPESVYGFRLLGLIQVSRGDHRDSVRYFKRALQIDPNDPDSLMWLTLIYSTVGRSALAKPLIQKLIVLDPLTPSNYMFVCTPPFYDGRFAEALKSIRSSYELDSGNTAHGQNERSLGAF